MQQMGVATARKRVVEPAARPLAAGPLRAPRSDRRASAARAAALLGALAVVASAYLLAAAAAGEPSQYVPARIGGWPNWLAGPLEGHGGSLSAGAFETLTLLMCAGYALVLVGARRTPAAAIALAIVAAHVALFLGPPLISQDV